MKGSLPKNYNQKILRACREFDLINPGDRILVGFSGGKDSAFLLYALTLLTGHGLFSVEIAAVTVDPGFGGGMDRRPLQDFCSRLQIKHFFLPTRIARAAQKKNQPCATCAYLRRARIAGFAAEQGFNKVALAHHHDDAVETFLMSILYSGVLRTFSPKTFLDRSQVTEVRPLVYLREKEILALQGSIPFQPRTPNCPYAGKTSRQRIKQLIADLDRKNPGVYANLAKAMREGRPLKLWPPEKNKKK